MEFTLSHFLRRSGEVLDAVTHEDVVLRRRDGDDILLTTAPRGHALRDCLFLFAATVLEALRDEPAQTTVVRSAGSAAPWTSSLTASERGRLLDDIARAATEAADLGVGEPVADALDRWRRAARATATTRPVSAHTTRPVAIPDDVDDPSVDKASGVVELPLRVRWSGPRRTYDLGDPMQLRLVYEQVLQEGIDEDVRRFIDVDTLLEHWEHLVLPRRVREAWARWLRKNRGVEVAW